MRYVTNVRDVFERSCINPLRIPSHLLRLALAILRRQALVSIIGVAMTASTVAQAQSASQPPAPRTLSTMDYIEIELLSARLLYMHDTGDDYGWQFADTFTPDGQMIANGVTTSGRANLAAAVRKFTKANPQYVGHIIANQVIEPVGDGAVGYLYQVVVDKTERPGATYSERLPSNQVIRSGGLIKETYVRTKDGWRVKQREPVASANLSSQKRVANSSNAASPSPSGLSAQDNIEIRQLVARYAFALDSGAQDGNALADLFSGDGELIISKKQFRGRDAIAKLGKRGWTEGDRPANAASHFLTNQIVEMSASGPVGKQMMIKAELAADGTPGKGFTIGGHYEDQYTRTPDGWRFKRREFIEDENDLTAKIPVVKPPLPAVSAPMKAAGAGATSVHGNLTADDYIEIRQLDSHYGFAVDLWSPDVNGLRGDYYAQIFTPDGEIHASPQKRGNVPAMLKGSEALRQTPGGGGGPNFVNHFNFNRLIEPTATGARGKVALLVIFPGHGSAADITVVGHYDVYYKKTPVGWRIDRRIFYSSTPDLGEALMERFK